MTLSRPTRADFDRLAARRGLDGLADRLWPLMADCIRLTADLSGGSASHLGGSPELPDHLEWPRRDGRALSFIAQLDCGELRAAGVSTELPADGTVYFFYDREDEPWGFDPADAEGFAVIWVPGDATLRPVGPPTELLTDSYPSQVLPRRVVRAEAGVSMPSVRSDELELLALDDDQQEAYEAFCGDLEQVGDQRHQVAGYPDLIQDDPRLTCELVTNGLYCGDETGYEDPVAAALAGNAGNWRLLAQFSSDDELDLMWSDSGNLFFFITTADLEARRFNNTWVVLQSC